MCVQGDVFSKEARFLFVLTLIYSNIVETDKRRTVKGSNGLKSYCAELLACFISDEAKGDRKSGAYLLFIFFSLILLKLTKSYAF